MCSQSASTFSMYKETAATEKLHLNALVLKGPTIIYELYNTESTFITELKCKSSLVKSNNDDLQKQSY